MMSSKRGAYVGYYVAEIILGCNLAGLPQNVVEECIV